MQDVGAPCVRVYFLWAEVIIVQGVIRMGLGEPAQIRIYPVVSSFAVPFLNFILTIFLVLLLN